ncbi:MAG: DUF4293 domain-containing protein [Bacteroides sp.]|nr:DUF4293 domain-containing protein [Bacteroides sp.]MBD5419293.1 DUF4293 domain-containing protein [Bacteroides sp.]MDE7461933.1 DUF4293 domain-containing protein [Muribaculaceae bacterium]
MVIQRWQSVLLLVAVILMGCFTFMSLGQVQSDAFTFNFTTCGFYPEGQPTGTAAEPINTWYFFAVSLLSAVLPLIAIFCFKHYRLQKNLCLWTMLLLVCVVVIGAVLGYQTIDGAYVSWSSLVCAPFISIIAVCMALSRINADYRLIRESERLR